jgi:predicted dinucleotide-binding enzyme
MTIRDWEGIALIIGVGDIGKCMSDYLKTVSPKLDVIVCGRNLKSQNGIY